MKNNLDASIKAIKDAKRIFTAGTSWKNFDFEKGLKELIKKDKTGEWIYYAARDWKEFDFKKGLDGLIKVDKQGYWIYLAGGDWKIFDFKKGLDALIKIDEDGYWIYSAGIEWRDFDYATGLKALEKFPKYPRYHELALTNWYSRKNKQKSENQSEKENNKYFNSTNELDAIRKRITIVENKIKEHDKKIEQLELYISFYKNQRNRRHAHFFGIRK